MHLLKKGDEEKKNLIKKLTLLGFNISFFLQEPKTFSEPKTLKNQKQRYITTVPKIKSSSTATKIDDFRHG